MGIVGRGGVEGWRTAFKRTKFVVLDGCSHHGLNERPDRYIEEMESWLKAND